MTIKVREIGSFHIGGRIIRLENIPEYSTVVTPGNPPKKINANGDHVTGQMYVQYIKLEKPESPYPIVFIHGGGMTGVCWENTPDGRKGWQMRFLEYGYDVYISDSAERGRASWNMYPAIYKSSPIFRTLDECWTEFRIGSKFDHDPDKRIAYRDQQFPVESFENFGKQLVPRWTTNNAAIETAYDEYLTEVGPCILIAHSQGGIFAANLALKKPQYIKGVVLLEPSSCPQSSEEHLAKLQDIPFLYIWGDNIEKSPTWTKFYNNVYDFFDRQQKVSRAADWIDLPSRNIKGNSHCLMMDKNSFEIAEIVNKWLMNNI